ncbi:hypothetical protein AB0P37_08440 [Streptomyces antimycoticus]|uniref:hypothetical protein n=1 Tax=Streptomyces antimycoticus TaxID=68175 RepID=UPI0034208E61
MDHAADYRRERYAAAMAAANDGGPEWAYEWYPEADAAMAVADEEHDLIREAAEFHQRRYVAAHDENARLRAELDASERRYRSSVETYQDMRAEFSKVVRWREEDAKEMERLRTELATVKEECESWKDTFYGQG